jgi:tRNA A-37 threonylcarbamoyl transferase component Bud32/tetratricopeptide (TPR) repeat protein
MELLGRRFGHIRITDVVGQGGMGDVYVGYDEKLDRKVALKVLRAENRLDGEARERLLREARALSKLDHPHICRIHDYIESGEVDLLVLEYIDGRTLQDVVLDGHLSRAEKLRIAREVAEVLVAAHRLGIIHRDLKPENVMITKSGSVKVLDFGLARWLNVNSSGRHLRAVNSSAATAAPFSGRGVNHTQAGVTMGTPLYMSPEQARGGELTTASDMYSAGLLLQFLFTGVDPHPHGLTAREVMLRAARGEKVAGLGVPGDVAALVAQLASFAPADRPTAVETSARLKLLNEKPRRLARQAGIALAVLVLAIASWRYVADLTRERAIAVAARAEAESRRAQAENLIEFMLGDLREKLVPVGRLDILDDVGERALQYVGSLSPETLSAEELARNSKALNQLGEVRVGQGKLGEAHQVFKRSLALAELAVKREPGSAPAQLAVATSHFWIGDVYRRQTVLPQAEEHYAAYLSGAERLAIANPANDDYQLERAYGHGNVGMVLEAQGDLRGALEHYRTSFEIKNARLQRSPADPRRRADVARAVNKVGGVQQRLGDLAGARAQFENEAATYRGLLLNDPRQTQWKQLLASSLAFLGVVRLNLGDVNGALECAEEELAINRELAARDPQNVQWQRNLAIASWRLADLARTRGDRARALELASSADRLLRRVNVPERHDWTIELAGIDTTLARLLAETNQRARGEAMLAAITRSLPAGGTVEERRRLAGAWFHLGEMRRSRGAAADAQRAWMSAHEQLRTVVPMSSDPQLFSLWIRVLARLQRVSEARFARTHLQAMAFHDDDLETVCREEGI